MKKIFVAAAISLLTPIIASAETAIKVLPNAIYPNQALSTQQIIELVKKNVDLSSSAKLYSANVQTIVDVKTKKPAYLLVHLLSSESYSFTTTKIMLNQHFQKVGVTSNYKMTQQDYAQQPSALHVKAECPDEMVQMVSGTPVPYISTAEAAIKNVTRQAQAYGYAAVELLGDKATTQNYLAYLNCPNLKGFYNVGHGSENGISLDDGVLSNTAISEELKNKLHRKTVVLFNSCEVFRNPLKGAVINDADAKKYAGGITPLLIGPSELASQCFWNSSFAKKSMTVSMIFCNKYFNATNTWGIGGKGKDIFTDQSVA